MVRRSAYLVAGVVLAGLGLLATAPATWAHAMLMSSSPADGAVVAQSPDRVSAVFDEPVGVSADSLRVFAPNGRRVDTGGAAHRSTPQQITVALLPRLGGGTYTVGWHVISADSHPVHGTFTFSVGAPSSSAVNPDALGPAGSRLVGVIFGIARWLAFCCFALLIGAIAFVICCWPAGVTHRKVRRLTIGAWTGLLLATHAALLLQGVYGTGQSVGHVLSPDVLHATLYSRYGRALEARLILLVVAALFVFIAAALAERLIASRRARSAALAAWAVITAALASTWAMADHSGAGSQVPLALPADVIHLSAIAVRLGGLTMLATIVLRRPRPAGPWRTTRGSEQAATAEAARAVRRFSPIPLGCVAAIVITGTYQSWRNVGTLGALTGTTYGRLLLLKIAAMCALTGLGYLARVLIAQGVRAPAETIRLFAAAAIPATAVKVGAGARAVQIGAGAGNHPERIGGADTRGAGTGATVDAGAGNGRQPRPDRMTVSLARLRWSVTAEAGIAAVVLAVTAVLVNTPTAREAYKPPASATAAFDTGGPGGRGSIQARVTPAQMGPNQIRLSLTSGGGTPFRPQQIQAALSLPIRHLGPLTARLVPRGPGQYVASVNVPFTGRWQLRITVRSDAFDETTVSIPVSVR